MWTWNYEKKELQYTGVLQEVPAAEGGTEKASEEEKKEYKAVNEQELIKLDHIKDVAMRSVKKVHICPKDFRNFISLPIVRDLLLWALRYFYYYFKELDFEQPFLTDRMGGFMSHNLKDKSLYECLYTLLIEVVFITFGKKDYDIIKKEVGRLVRSDEYCPEEEDSTGSTSGEIEMEERKMHTKHFQNSPLLLCVLLPADKKPLHSPSGYEAHLDTSKKKEESSEILTMSDEKLAEFIWKELENVGILGMKKTDFDEDLELI